MSDRAMFRFSIAAFADPKYAIVDVAPPPEDLLERLGTEGSESWVP